MNSLEAIIATLALLSSLGILIGAVSSQEKNFQNAADGITAKIDSLKCAFIIDSIISNSAEKYVDSINCTAEKNKVSSKINSSTKSTFILTEAKSEETISITKYKHYK